MPANVELNRIKEWNEIKGFKNLFAKENRGWWGTRRWLVNALLWIVVLCGLTAVLLFAQNDEVLEAAKVDIDAAGGVIAYTVMIGIDVFFQFGVPVLAISTVILMLDVVIGEKQSGEAEWLLSKPITRSAYILAKLAANIPAVLLLLVGLPSLFAYILFSIRTGAAYEIKPLLSGVGIMAVHTLFYLTFTLMLGVLFNKRGPILGLALGSILGGGMIGGLIKPLIYITPWVLPKMASMIANGQGIPVETGSSPLIASGLWCLIFIVVSMARFEKTEF